MKVRGRGEEIIEAILFQKLLLRFSDNWLCGPCGRLLVG